MPTAPGLRSFVLKMRYVLLGILLIGALTMTGCGAGGPAAQDGDAVRVHYTGTLADGSQFDSSAGRDPLEFTLGQGGTIPGFEKAVLGMKVGETKTVTIPAADAYGPHREELTVVVDRAELPAGMEPVVGQQFEVMTEQNPISVTVTEVTDTTITLDANYFLAGKDLTFDIELVSINGEPAPD